MGQFENPVVAAFVFLLMSQEDPDEQDEPLESALSFLDTFELLQDHGTVLGEDLMLLLDAQTQETDALLLDALHTMNDDAAAALAGAQLASRTAQSERNAATKPKRSRPSTFKPNRARDGRKNELVYLRNRVREMEEQLQQLREHGGRSAASSLRLVGSPPLRSPQSLLPHKAKWFASGWEAIAARQFAERHRADLENLHLKKMLQGQIKIARDLEKVLSRRSNVSICGSPRDVLSLRRHPLSALDSDTEMYEKLLTELDTAVLEMDAIFESNGLNTSEEPLQDAAIRTNEADGGIRLDVFANTMMPFDVQTTSDGVWRYMDSLVEQNPNRSYYGREQKRVSRTDKTDTIIETYGVEIQASGTAAHFRFRQVNRRYVEDQRVLIAWVMVIDPIEYSCQPVSGLHFFEKGFTLIKRPGTGSPDTSLLQWCHVMTPQWTDKQGHDKRKVGELSDFLIDCSSHKIHHGHQMIESLLLDESMKTK